MNQGLKFGTLLLIAVIALGGLDYYTYYTLNSQDSSNKTTLMSQIDLLQSQISHEQTLLQNINGDLRSQVGLLQNQLNQEQALLQSINRTLNNLAQTLSPYYLVEVAGMKLPSVGYEPWSLNVTSFSGPSFGPSDQVLIRGELFEYNVTGSPALLGTVSIVLFSQTGYGKPSNEEFYWLASDGSQIENFPAGTYTATFQPLLCGSPPLFDNTCVNAGPPLRVGPFQADIPYA